LAVISAVLGAAHLSSIRGTTHALQKPSS
jgi:hypothetical protein